MKRELIFLSIFILLLLPITPTPPNVNVSHSSPTSHYVSYVPEALTTPTHVSIPQFLVATSGNVTYISVADVNEDGHKDVRTIETDGTFRYVKAYRLDGTELFSKEFNYRPLAVEVYDLNSNVSGSDFIVVRSDGTNAYVNAYHLDGTPVLSSDLIIFKNNITDAQIGCGNNFTYVFYRDNDVGSVHVVALNNSGLSLIASYDFTATSYERVVKGDVNLVVLAGSAYVVTVSYNPTSTSFEISSSKIGDDYDKVVTNEDARARLVRAGGRLYMVSYSPNTAGGYIYTIENIGSYLNVGAGYIVNVEEVRVGDGSNLRYFRRDVSGTRSNSSYGFSSTVLHIGEYDYNNNGTEEIVVFTASGMYTAAYSKTQNKIVVHQVLTYGTTIQNFYEVMSGDFNSDGYLDFIVFGTPTVVILGRSSSEPSLQGTISVSVKEYAVGDNGIYLLDQYDNVYLYGYDATKKANVSENVIGLDKNFHDIVTAHPENKEVLFMKAENGFIALNGSTLLPVRYLKANPDMRVEIPPYYLVYVSGGNMFIETIALDHSAPVVNASLDRPGYNPNDEVVVNITASDNVYVYKVNVSVGNGDIVFKERTIPVYDNHYEGSIRFNISTVAPEPLSPGLYVVVVRASDGDGLVSTYTVPFYVDDGNSPEIEYLGPSVVNTELNVTHYFAFNVTDVSPVNVTIKYSFDGTNRKEAPYTINRNIYNASIKITSYGYLYIRITAVDVAGNENSMEVSVIVDDGNAPNVTITVGDQYEVYDSATVNVTVSDVTQTNTSISIIAPNGTVVKSVSTTNTSYSLSVLVDNVGNRTVKVVAEDLAGHVSTSNRSFLVVDTVAPQIISFVYPEYVDVNATFSVSINVTDNYYKELSLKVVATSGNKSSTVFNGTVPIGSSSISLSVPYIGNVTLEVTLTDGSGNSVSATYIIRVDDGSGPSVSIEAPESVEVYYEFSAKITVEDVFYDYMNVSIIAPNGTEVYSNHTTSTELTVSVTPDVLGERTVRVVAVDKAGHVSESEKVVNVVDITAPQIEVLSYPNVTNVNESIIVRILVDDNYYHELNVTVYANGLKIHSVSVPTGESELSFSIPIYGFIELNFTVIDGSGNSASTTVSVLVDDGKGPEITIQAPERAPVYSNETILVKALDDTDVTLNVSIKIYDVLTGNLTEYIIYTNERTHSIGFSLYFDVVGNRTVIVTAADEAGNIGYGYFTILVYDNVTPTIMPVYPTETVDVGEEIDVSVSITDNYAMSENISVSVNGTEVSYQIVSENRTTIVIEFSYVPAEPGAYVFTIVSYDALGNVNSVEFSVNVKDLTSPTVKISAPGSHEVMESMSVIVVATDNYMISQVTLYYSRDQKSRNKTTLIKLNDTARKASIVPDELGTLYLKAVAYDPAGHSSVDQKTVRIYDDVAPTIDKIDVPLSVVNGENISISVYVSDNYKVDHVEIYVSYDNATRTKLEVTKSGDSRVAYYVPEETGTLYIKVVAYDVAGNESSEYAEVTVNMNTKALLIGVAIIVILIALLALIVKLRRRR